MKRGPVSDGLQCPRCSLLHIRIGALPAHTLRNPQHPARLSLSTLLVSKCAATTAVCVCCLCVCVCVCVAAGRVGVVWCHRNCSLSWSFIPSGAQCSLSDRCHKNMEKGLKNNFFFPYLPQVLVYVLHFTAH